MMFGYADEGRALLVLPALLWVPFGPFAMIAMGVWCACVPGRRPRLWSLLVPLVPVTASAVVMAFPLSRWDRPVLEDGTLGTPEHLHDFLGYLAVYVGGITLLPWLLGYGIARVARLARARRRAPRPPRGPDPAPTHPDAS
ncbi:hypothetical protein ABZO31_33960 [Streptomyces sp. HUAS MG47]|uniref:hypothetical protein n=1 Tax=Streptomyces solicamelliae TaxID=3231716 RepID=UPI0038784223